MEEIKKIIKDKRGSALVETAIVIPILLGIFMGLILFANAYRYKIIMSMAAKEGARMYKVSMRDSNEAIKKAKEELAVGRISAHVTMEGGNIVITKPYGIKIPLFGQHLLNLKAKHEFKDEVKTRYYGKEED